jgi:osmotically inducible protein OsmC
MVRQPDDATVRAQENHMGISKASAEWTGSLKEGKGSVAGGSGKFSAPFSFTSRFEGAAGGTNPEELIGAALAGCFSMFLSAQLSKDGHVPTRIATTAQVHLDAGPAVTKIELETVATVPGIDEKLFNEKVEFSKQNCPISKALASVPTLTVNARLER